jgi:uncharacterized protein (TIGR00297 family)
MHSETGRQWVHIGSGLFALLLRVLTPWQASSLAATAIVFNALVLPRLGGRRLYRPIDHARGFPLGILLYPLAVLLLTLIFPSRPDIVAAAWAILAFGDGAATLAGRAAQQFDSEAAKPRARSLSPNPARSADSPLERGRLPWNPDKSIAGTAAFIACGGLAGVALAWWTRGGMASPPPLAFTVAAPLAAAVVAAFVETIPVRLDDNISVPAAAATVLWLASVVDGDAIAAALPAVRSALPWAIGVNAVTAWLGYRAKTVSLSGMVAGAIVGIVIYAAGGAGAWGLLFVTFLAAAVASRLGLQRKVLLGIAEERGGRRGAGNALANCGVATVAALAAVTTPHATGALLALVAALVAGGSDTVASEIGKAWGRSTFLVTTLGRVKPGTPGAMSLEGTVAGIAAAFVLAEIGVAFGLIGYEAILAVVAGATLGALAESALAATLEGPGILNNDVLNFINTAVAAAMATALV